MSKTKFSETQLTSIDSEAARWPAATASPMWAALHSAAVEIRAIVRSADVRVAEIKANRSLSDIGRLRQVGTEVLNHLADLYSNDKPNMETARTRVAAFVESEAAEIEKVAAPTAGPMAAEIRDFIRSQKDPAQWCRANLKDENVYNAVASGPAFLSGLTAKEHAEIKAAGPTLLAPEAAKAKELAEKALSAAEKMLVRAERKLVEIANGAILQRHSSAYNENKYALKYTDRSAA